MPGPKTVAAPTRKDRGQSVEDGATSQNVVQLVAAGELTDERPALIPPGEYRLRLTHWQTAILWGRSHKVVLHFTVCDIGPHFGAKISRYYNVEKVVGNPSRNGRFKLRWNHDLVREYAMLLPMPQRLDRLYLERLKSLLIVGRVATTSTNARQKRIPDALQYSVVRELLRIEIGT